MSDWRSLDDIDMALCDDFQRAFPLALRPFAAIGEPMSLSEDDVIARYRRLKADGYISRIGAVLPPHRYGHSTLAALAVPPERLDAVAAQVSARSEVNHNYAREHDYNLWFVVTAADEAAVAATLESIERETGLAPLDLPLEESFHIDLGFSLRAAPGERRRAKLAPFEVDDAPTVHDRRIAMLAGEGLTIEARPYAALARAAGVREAEAILALERMQASGALKRFGVIVRHHEFGFNCNAMTVWNIAEDQVSAIGRAMAESGAVTLCYRRPRRLPHWPYNLFCMIHGRARDEVLTEVAPLARQFDVSPENHAVLFSTRRFKQRGARYGHEAAA